jgi:hypothetical protein
VHFSGETTSVALDATERLAYVGLGAKGLALVDLDGPASVQPIDADRNGTDDRILGIVDTPGGAERTALALDRGIAFAADGVAGLTTIQLLPPRTSFSTLLRDPVTVLSGEEQDITASPVAYVTDDAVRVTVTAVVPPAAALVLAIEDAGPEGDGPLVSFDGGRLATSLVSGANVVAINDNHQSVQPARVVRLVTRTQSGEVIATQKLAFASPNTNGTSLVRLAIGPPNPTLSDAQPTLKVGVAGFYADGRVFNLTEAASGTTYEIARPVIATVDSSGLVTSAAGGTTDLFAYNGTASADVILQVNRAAALEGLSVGTDHLTFRAIGDALTYPVVGQFSDGRVETDVSRMPARRSASRIRP